MSDWVSMLCGLGEMTPLEEVLPNGSSSGLLLHMDGKSFAFEGEPGGTVELNDDRGVSVFTDYNGDGLIRWPRSCLAGIVTRWNARLVTHLQNSGV